MIDGIFTGWATCREARDIEGQLAGQRAATVAENARSQVEQMQASIAGLECIFMPFGTVLGVFTLIALNKDSIKEMFSPPTPPPQIQTAPSS